MFLYLYSIQGLFILSTHETWLPEAAGTCFKKKYLETRLYVAFIFKISALMSQMIICLLLLSLLNVFHLHGNLHCCEGSMIGTQDHCTLKQRGFLSMPHLLHHVKQVFIPRTQDIFTRDQVWNFHYQSFFPQRSCVKNVRLNFATVHQQWWCPKSVKLYALYNEQSPYSIWSPPTPLLLPLCYLSCWLIHNIVPRLLRHLPILLDQTSYNHFDLVVFNIVAKLVFNWGQFTYHCKRN